ncbi:MAG: hypothetical protein ACR2LL_11480 [Nitrosopumilus sp.]
MNLYLELVLVFSLLYVLGSIFDKDNLATGLSIASSIVIFSMVLGAAP